MSLTSYMLQTNISFPKENGNTINVNLRENPRKFRLSHRNQADYAGPNSNPSFSMVLWTQTGSLPRFSITYSPMSAGTTTMSR